MTRSQTPAFDQDSMQILEVPARNENAFHPNLVHALRYSAKSKDVASSRLASSRLDGLDGLASGVVQVVGSDDVHLGGLQNLLAALHVGTLQPHDKGHLKLQAGRSVHDALRNDVALHDATCGAWLGDMILRGGGGS